MHVFQALDLLSPNWGLLFWKTIVFGVTFWLLYKYAWGPEGQPEAGNDIRGAMIVGAALIEGAVLFCFVICILLALKVPLP